MGKHDHKSDAWVVIRDTVYDVTKFKDSHPGGVDVIMRRAGKDATKKFTNANHPIHAIEETLPRYRIGEIKSESKKEYWQKEEKTGKGDLFCAIILFLGLASSFVYLSI